MGNEELDKEKIAYLLEKAKSAIAALENELLNEEDDEDDEDEDEDEEDEQE